MMDNNMPIEATLLGKHTEYPKQYAPDILVAVPRRLNRDIYGIDDKNLPFVGADAWHAYELSWLNHRGIPTAGVLKIVYPCNSEFLVESKSLKLYLNSFNMHHANPAADNGLNEIREIISHDLSATVGAPVSVSIHGPHAYESAANPFADFVTLEDMPECFDIEASQYTEDPSILMENIITAPDNGSAPFLFASHLLRSNCKITHQPDWGSVFIHFRPKANGNIPSPQSMLRYIVSLRGENHFHEEICEMIYVRLQRLFSPAELAVTCIYTRRGGIDICPSRASSKVLLPEQLLQSQTIIQKLARQ